MFPVTGKYRSRSNSLGIAIYIMDGALTMTGTTIAGNTADAVGGVPQQPAVLNIFNSVIAQNRADGNGDDIFRSDVSSTLSARSTLSSYTGWTESETCFEYDPDLPLFADAETGDFTLAAGSQAIDLGDNNYVTAETDLAGSSPSSPRPTSMATATFRTATVPIFPSTGSGKPETPSFSTPCQKPPIRFSPSSNRPTLMLT